MMLRVLFCFGITQLSEDYQKISESFHLKILLASSRHFWLHTENRKQRNTFYCSGLQICSQDALVPFLVPYNVKLNICAVFNLVSQKLIKNTAKIHIFPVFRCHKMWKSFWKKSKPV